MGEPVESTWMGQAQTYDLRAASTGTLVLKLSWDASIGASLNLGRGPGRSEHGEIEEVSRR